ncbi:TonB family protein [Pseudotabrizicola algicola]|uniref:TonB family protein n=1 Tax=Pseudotabrizicola algicola TaxID=2709381 RepID=A0A6B3RJT0_9RHOB|nr:TonB family protein [Pseudotabrizicola algicola]NEX45403.1 TonB family protein [Pseudotabrizicola algicola]
MRQSLPFAAALAISGALHAAGAIAITSKEATAIEGGGGATIALLGESFEDLAIGAQPVAATTPAEPRQTPTAVAAPAPVPPVPMATTPAPAPVPALAPRQDADLPAAAPMTQELHPVTPPVAAQPVQSAAEEVSVTSAAPDRSPRPRARSEQPAPEQAEARKAAPAGNADRNARKGSESGKASAGAAATASNRTAESAQTGSAASSTYPGLVLRQIERTRKPAIAARGTVVVAFRVGPSGALAASRIARSTGDPQLERAALDHIRRAAPFPPPPAGATTDFTFEFVGRR